MMLVSVPAVIASADHARALDRAVPRPVGVFLPVLVDALHGDDGIVDEHADGEQQAHHRQDVEADAEEVHAAERHHEAHRDRQRHHRRRPPVAQEEEQHQHRQQGALETGLAELAQRIGDALGLVLHEEELQALHLRLARGLLDFLEHEATDLDQVGAALAADFQRHRRTLVEAALVVEFGRAQADFGDVAEAQARVRRGRRCARSGGPRTARCAPPAGRRRAAARGRRRERARAVA